MHGAEDGGGVKMGEMMCVSMPRCLTVPCSLVLSQSLPPHVGRADSLLCVAARVAGL